MSGFSPTILIVSWQVQIELRVRRPAVLEVGLQRAAQQPGEHPEALGPVERVVGVALGQDRLAGVGEQVAELPPRGAVDDLLRDLVHRLIQSAGVTPPASSVTPRFVTPMRPPLLRKVCEMPMPSMTGTPSTATSVDAILAATRRVIAERGPEKFTMSAIAAAAGVSRPTLYRWFPTKDALLEALTAYEEQLFDARLEAVIDAQRSPGRRLDAALRLPRDLPRRSDGPRSDRRRPGLRHPVARPLAGAADGRRSSGCSATPSTTVPAVRLGHLTREQAAELFLRLAYSHYLVPHPEPEVLLANLRSFAGLSRRSITEAVG